MGHTLFHLLDNQAQDIESNPRCNAHLLQCQGSPLDQVNRQKCGKCSESMRAVKLPNEGSANQHIPEIGLQTKDAKPTQLALV